MHQQAASAWICKCPPPSVSGEDDTLSLRLSSIIFRSSTLLKKGGARVTKAGKAQLFAAAELIAWRDGAEVLAASASAVLAKVG